MVGTAVVALAGCAQLYSVQMGELDGACTGSCRPFEVMVSESGVNVQEAGNIAKNFTRTQKGSKQVDDVMAIIGLFQTGPKTGNPVFNDTYADSLAMQVMEKCPSGDVGSIVSIRESRKYPVISGEIVKVKGYCYR